MEGSRYVAKPDRWLQAPIRDWRGLDVVDTLKSTCAEKTSRWRIAFLLGAICLPFGLVAAPE